MGLPHKRLHNSCVTFAANSGGTANVTTQKKSPRGKPFAKGQSGNPTGRPRVAEEFRELCREASPKAFAYLLKQLDGAFGSDAAKTILAYAWGKPTDKVEMTGKDGGPIQFANMQLLTDNELDSLHGIAESLAARMAKPPNH